MNNSLPAMQIKKQYIDRTFSPFIYLEFPRLLL